MIDFDSGDSFSQTPRKAYTDGILCVAKMKHDLIAALMTPEVVRRKVIKLLERFSILF